MKDIIGELNKYPDGYWDFKGKIKTGVAVAVYGGEYVTVILKL